MQNRFKIDQKWYPGGAWGDPRGLPGASRGTVRACFQMQLKINEKIEGFGRLPGCPGRPPETQRDPQNRSKIDFLPKNDFPTVDFCRFLCTRPFFTLLARLCIDFWRKINEKSIEKTMHVFTAALVFLSMATLTKHRILRYESYFFMFRVFVFFPKNCEKMTSKCKEQFSTQKSHQNGPRGPVLGPKMVPNSRRRG